jgi:hypothetical protein
MMAAMEAGSGPAEASESSNVSLAHMECLTSCVLTYLNIIGHDYRRLMLDYWNLNYQYKTLLSGKEARQLPLRQLFGIELQSVRGDGEQFMLDVMSGKSVVYLCAAGNLDYFPREYLGMESAGFRHAILIYGWNEQDRRYRVADPVVNVVTELAPDAVLRASAGAAGMYRLTYFTLEAAVDTAVQVLDDESGLAYCSRRLLQAYRNDRSELPTVQEGEGRMERERSEAWLDWFGNRHGGMRALERFEEDLMASQGWESKRRADWIDRNVMTIASIKRIRSFVWQQYVERGAWVTDKQEQGKAQVDAIHSGWSTLSYLMMKYKHNPADTGEAAVRAIRVKVEQIKHAELAFLTWLHEACGKEEGA